MINVATTFEVTSVESLSQNNEIMRTALLLPNEVEVDALVSMIMNGLL